MSYYINQSNMPCLPIKLVKTKFELLGQLKLTWGDRC